MKLSARSHDLISNPTGIVKAHMKCQEDLFSLNNPQGHINFGTAENDLMSKEMSEKLVQYYEVNPSLIHYHELSGTSSLRDAFCNFAAKNLDINLESENIVVQNGVSSICESLSYCLLNPGDKIFTFAPYYSGFDYDFKRFHGKIIPINLSPEDHYYHHRSALDETYELHPEVKALLICHPHNPTGRILSSDEISNIIAWCEQKKIHLIVDEIYALSLIDPKKPFQSFLHKDFEKYENIHFLYGLAKDFGLGGFKVGFFHTRNQELLERMQVLSYFHCVSSLTQSIVAKMLDDQPFISSYIPENQKRLKTAYNKLHNLFPNFSSPEAGLYCYWKISNRELIDFDILLEQHKVSILPGKFFHDPSEGYFRICFAKGEAALNEFVVRFQNFLTS